MDQLPPPPRVVVGKASPAGAGMGFNCAGCGKFIAGRTVNAMGIKWHPDCFKCDHCGEHLEHVAFYEHDGKAYCHFDYHELFSLRCFHCKTPIVDERFIEIDDPELGKRTYHDLHFFCANCGDPFLDPSSPTATHLPPHLRQESGGGGGGGGDERGGAPEGKSKEFVVVRGHPYCEACHVRLHKPKCWGCKKPVAEEVVKALNKSWHPECFVCESCKRPFETESFFVRQNKPYCQHCFEMLLRNEV